MKLPNKIENSSIWDDLKKPTNLIGLFIGVIGLLSSVFFWIEGKKTKKISYQVIQPSVKIFDSKNALSKIHLVERDIVNINEDVYLITGKIWNSGDLPVNPTDVRRAVQLNLKGCKRVLDYQVNFQTDSSVNNFNLIQTNANTFSLRWNYFDSGNGLGFQIIYLGNEKLDFSMTGNVLDLTGFQDVKVLGKSKVDVWILRIGILGLFFTIVYGFRFIYQERKDANGLLQKGLLVALFLVCSFGIGFLIWTVWYLMSGGLPPF